MRYVLPVALIAVLSSLPVAGQDLASMTAADLERGQTLYQGRCARCHGQQGLGGEGPSLARPFLTRARDDEGLVALIANGIPGTSMPGAGPTMSDLERRQIAAYVRSLGRVRSAPVTGDIERGAALFREPGECTSCHGMDGEGSAFGPDLRDISLRRGPEYLEEAILAPAAHLPQGLTAYFPMGFREFLPVTVAAGGGRAVRGYRVNEDTFVILVRDEEGTLHAVRKPGAEVDKRMGESLMPDYEGTYTDEELNDLVAFLMSLGRDR